MDKIVTLERILEMDHKLTEKLRLPDDRPGLKRLAAFLAHSGDSWFWGLGLVLLWFLGPPNWQPVIQLLLIGILFTALSVLGLKFLIRRPRPEGEWGQIYRRSDPHSFPSGHAARAIMLTMIMLLSGYIWIGIFMLAWSLLVDLSRIGLGVHFLSDILAGTLIGILMGAAAVLII